MLGTAAPLERCILLIEEDPSIAGSLRYSLEAVGYRVRVAASGREALEMVAKDVPDLLLMDVVLPDTSGFEVCRRVRARGHAVQPSIIFVAARAEEADRVAAFEVGADDFLAKPYSMEELLLRIQARLPVRATRASVQHEAPALDAPVRRLVLGPLEIDMASHRVFLSGKEVSLSVQEMRLLAYLAGDPGKLRARRDLLTVVWGYHPDAASRTLDTHVKRLRDKFGPLATMIQTVHGVGYRLAVPMHRAPNPDGPVTARNRRRR